MDDRQYLANVITTSWAGIVPNNMVMLPMDSSTSSASIILVEEFHLNGREPLATGVRLSLVAIIMVLSNRSRYRLRPVSGWGWHYGDPIEGSSRAVGRCWLARQSSWAS